MSEKPRRRETGYAPDASPRVRRAASQRGDHPVGVAHAAAIRIGQSAAWLFERVMAQPAAFAGATLGLGIASYVSVNALGLQQGRHPAPILPQPKPQPASERGPRATAPLPRPEPVRHVPTNGPTHPPTPAEPVAPLLRPAEDTTASVTRRTEGDVAQAQRALRKLGHPSLADDGVMGRETKAAIEAFERAHKLPVTGAAAGRTLQVMTKAAAAKR